MVGGRSRTRGAYPASLQGARESVCGLLQTLTSQPTRGDCTSVPESSEVQALGEPRRRTEDVNRADAGAARTNSPLGSEAPVRTKLMSHRPPVTPTPLAAHLLPQWDRRRSPRQTAATGEAYDGRLLSDIAPRLRRRRGGFAAGSTGRAALSCRLVVVRDRTPGNP